MAGHIQTSKSVDWCTPASILNPIKAMWGEIVLDPCSNGNSIVKAQNEIKLPTDSLSVDWTKYLTDEDVNHPNSIFINPPYGRDKKRGTSIYNWIEKAYSTYTSSKAEFTEVMMLIPAAVDTRAWQNIIFPSLKSTYARVCFLKGRVKFVNAPTGCPMAMALVYWGSSYTDNFGETFKNMGHIVESVY